jgi:nucleotide-binding universal stress UspA family protein
MPGIIVGIDGSDHSRRALEWAVREAAIRQAPLTVITVHQVASSIWTGRSVPYPHDDELAERSRKSAQEETDQVLAQDGDRPPEVTVKAVSGLPAEQLLAAAKGADMVVMGSRGAGGFARLLLGSVSSQVTHHASCPVVIIPQSE